MIPSKRGSQRTTFPQMAGMLSGLLGLFVLVGWAFGIPWIKGALPGGSEMKANTAVGLLLSGVALFLVEAQSSRWRWTGRFMALIVAILGLATMGEYLLGWWQGIDQLLFLGRMSPYSTVAFAMIGLGLFALPVHSLRWLVWLAAMLTIVISCVSLIGYVWSVGGPFAERIVPVMAVSTAIAFAILGIGMLIASLPPAERKELGSVSLSSVEIRTLAGFLGALLLLLVVGGQTYRASVAGADSSRRVAHTQQIRASLGLLYAALSDAESQQRNHLLSAKPYYLEDSNRHAAEAAKRATDLAQLIADNPAQLHRLYELQVLIGKRLDVLNRTSAIFEQSGLAAAQERVSSGEGRQLMTEIRNSIDRMDAVEEGLLKTRSAEFTNDETKTLLSLLATLSVASAGFLALYSGVRRELTNRTQAEAALRRSEESLAVTLHSIGDAVLATDREKRVTRMNSVAEKLTGWTEAEAQGRPIAEVFKIVNEETRQPTLIPVDEVLATGKIHGLANHTIIIARDGTERPIADSAAPIRDKSGRIFGVVLVFRDVTEEKEAEKALRDSEMLTRAVLNSIMANIAVVDRHGTIIAINEGWVRFARENNADATLPGVGVGANYLEVCKRAARDMGEGALEILDGIQGVLDRSRDTFKYEYPCHSPTQQRWFSMQVTPLSRADGGAVVAQLDITERKLAEQVLTDFKAALDEHAIVAITDAKGKITYVNDRFCAISRYAREELLGHDHRVINSRYHPKDFMRDLWETITSGQVWRGEIKNRAKDGSFFWLNTTIVPFLGADGKPTQYIAIRNDITKRKDAQERIEQLNAELRTQAVELAVANKELEAFSYSVSHDLRAPLRHVHGYVDMLTKATEGQLSEKAGRYLQVISDASQEMGQLIDDLLAFSRMGRAEMHEDSVDLNQLVTQTLHGMETVLADRSIVWKIATLPPATGDRAMLRQVLANLIGNAVKYTRPRNPAEIEIGYAGEENGRNIYFVRDNGAGFDMQYVHKLFGVFQRLHTAEEFEGTGIGLATVRRILTRHGDRIWAESAPDRGSTFYFTLKPAA